MIKLLEGKKTMYELVNSHFIRMYAFQYSFYNKCNNVFNALQIIGEIVWSNDFSVFEFL